MRISDWGSDVCSSDLACEGGICCARAKAVELATPRKANASTLIPLNGKDPRFRTSRGSILIRWLSPLLRSIDNNPERLRKFPRTDHRAALGMGAAGASALWPIFILVYASVIGIGIVAAYKTQADYAASSEAHTSELQSLMRISY